MKQHEISFKTFERRTRLTTGSVCYQGQLKHNRTLTPEATREAFAKFANIHLPQANLAIDSVCAFIEEEIAQGNRLDFGGFSVSLTMRGGLPSRNAPFDPAVNSIGVAMMPGSALRRAVSRLKPVNDVDRDVAGSLCHTAQTSPRRRGVDVISRAGERHVLTSGVGSLPTPTGENSGIWLEDDAGEKALVATDIVFDGVTYKYVFVDTVPAGLYWLVVCGRVEGRDEYVRLKRRLEVR